MPASLAGLLIRRERCRRHWSQQGLCKGVCSVSYLSKIERGRACADRAVLLLLMDRLELRWRDDAETQKEVAAELDDAFDAVLDRRERDARAAWRRVEADFERVTEGPYLIDGLALRAYFTGEKDPILDDPALTPAPRQLLLIHASDGRRVDLPARAPCAFSFLTAGEAAYYGGNYALAAEQLSRAYELAAAEGRAYIMLQAALLLGNGASNRMEYDRMTAHYRVAERLALALGEAESLETIRYNIAATALELGRTQEACRYFSALAQPTRMQLHKLAVCLERMGQGEAALAAVERAENTPEEELPDALTLRMLALVRYRLTHPAYLSDPAYGTLLLACFSDLRRALPSGYAGFHLPWVLEWHRANRQYRQAYELLLDFPAYTHIKADQQAVSD